MRVCDGGALGCLAWLRQLGNRAGTAEADLTSHTGSMYSGGLCMVTPAFILLHDVHPPVRNAYAGALALSICCLALRSWMIISPLFLRAVGMRNSVATWEASLASSVACLAQSPVVGFWNARLRHLASCPWAASRGQCIAPGYRAQSYVCVCVCVYVSKTAVATEILDSGFSAQAPQITVLPTFFLFFFSSPHQVDL